jgi:hypothetical protein
MMMMIVVVVVVIVVVIIIMQNGFILSVCGDSLQKAEGEILTFGACLVQLERHKLCPCLWPVVVVTAFISVGAKGAGHSSTKKKITSVCNCSVYDVELHYIVQSSTVPWYGRRCRITSHAL